DSCCQARSDIDSRARPPGPHGDMLQRTQTFAESEPCGCRRSMRRKQLTTLSRIRTSVASPVSGAAGQGEAHRGDGTRGWRRPKGNSAVALYLPDLNTQTAGPMATQHTRWSQFGVLVTVFFFWGFVAASNDILIPVFKNAFNLSQQQSMYVALAFYVAYTV